VTLAAGFSGHGFKFASVLGEVLAELATDGKPAYDLELFSLRRFADVPSLQQ
jgi:glycine/D-amino acid oxidase-like deaminating enzyme